MDNANNPSIVRMRNEQLKLAPKLMINDAFEKIETVAACDLSFRGAKVVAVMVICKAETMEVIEKKYSVCQVMMPYMPEYRAFRELPAVIDVYHKLERDFDLLLVPGQGILHPRKMGFASHLGLVLDKPTIGVAKTNLCGEERGDKIYVGADLRGVVLKTKEHANPIFVSPGNKISVKTAAELVRSMIREPHKFPEPLHIASRYAGKMQDKIDLHSNHKPDHKPLHDEHHISHSE